ncbi:MAG: hypothetical protein CFE43_21030 [Burkholderiales bacterium PBB3]|nr:MAG: hypothetical protein CFE43_21030 [Burkholderiales bacterium PBB3]
MIVDIWFLGLMEVVGGYIQTTPWKRHPAQAHFFILISILIHQPGAGTSQSLFRTVRGPSV